VDADLAVTDVGGLSSYCLLYAAVETAAQAAAAAMKATAADADADLTQKRVAELSVTLLCYIF
jgi:hypothetical protein